MSVNKKGDSEIIEITCDMWNTSVVITIGPDFDFFCQKILAGSQPDNAVLESDLTRWKTFHANNAVSGSATQLRQANGGCAPIIWLASCSIGTLAHECSHVAGEILKDAGADIKAHRNEPLAYLRSGAGRHGFSNP